MIAYDRWTVEQVAWDEGKLRGVWGLLQRHPTLFSDLTRGDFERFVMTSNDPYTVLLEVKDGPAPVGYFKAENLEQVIDCNAHAVFFDRKPAEKVQLGKLATRWMFDQYPLRRISAEIPDIYIHTLRFAEAVGFQREGVKRKAVCMNGQWRDLILMGLLREESYGRSHR